MYGKAFFRILTLLTINSPIFQSHRINSNNLNTYRKTPYLVPRINQRNKFFSKLFIRGLNCIIFWCQKITFRSRINPQENFFSIFFILFSFLVDLSPGSKSDFLRPKYFLKIFIYAIKTPGILISSDIIN